MKVMSQKTAQELNKKISDIKNEMGMLRSFIIGVLAQDQEGEYRPEFVKKILRLSGKKVDITFKDSESFLKQVQKSS